MVKIQIFSTMILSSIFLSNSSENAKCTGINRTIYGENLQEFKCVHKTIGYQGKIQIDNGEIEIAINEPGFPGLELYYDELCSDNMFSHTIYCNYTNYKPYPNCNEDKELNGNGICNSYNNIYECNYDGGDCCIKSCVGMNCPIIDDNCLDTKYTVSPTSSPTLSPTPKPTLNPTLSTVNPTKTLTISPTKKPTLNPTLSPTNKPTLNPTLSPTKKPTLNPTLSPTKNPTLNPTKKPTLNPTLSPTNKPTLNPTLSTINPTNNQNNNKKSIFFENITPNSTTKKYLWFVYGGCIIIILLFIIRFIIYKCKCNYNCNFNREQKNNDNNIV